MKLKYFSVLASLLGTLALENINVEGMRQDDLSKPISYSDWKENKKGDRAFTNVEYGKKDMTRYFFSLGVCNEIFLKAEKVELEEGITSIESYCFSNCSNLVSITIPTTVSSIGSYGFACCSNLKTINIPTSVKSIGSYCFYCCDNLSTIDIPTSVSSIGVGCFNECASLTSITLPSDLTTKFPKESLSISDKCKVSSHEDKNQKKEDKK